MKSIDESLRTLQTDHIDPKLEEAFQLLERMAQS